MSKSSPNSHSSCSTPGQPINRNGSLNSATNPRITFENFLGQGRINQLGGVFINGRPLPHEKRLQIVELARQGVKPCKISRELKVSHGAVSKILMRYNETGSISPGQIGGNPRSRISIQAVRQYILGIQAEQPTLTAAQVQQVLVRRGICSRENVPSGSRINRLLKAQKGAKGKRSEREDGSGGRRQQEQGSRPLSHSIENILGAQNSPLSAAQKANVFVDSPSLASSFYPSSVGGSGSDEENVQQNSNKKTTQQEQQPNANMMAESRRPRTAFRTEQLRLLEKTFCENPYPSQAQKEWLVRTTGLDEDKIITWFSNRRARRRKALQQCPSFQHLLLPAGLASPAAAIGPQMPISPQMLAGTATVNRQNKLGSVPGQPGQLQSPAPGPQQQSIFGTPFLPAGLSSMPALLPVLFSPFGGAAFGQFGLGPVLPSNK